MSAFYNASNFSGKYVSFFTDNISSVEVPRTGRRDEFLDFNARCVSFMDTEIPENTLEYDDWKQECKKSIELHEVRKCTNGIGEQCVSAECRLSLKCMQSLKQKLFAAKRKLDESIEKAYDVITSHGSRKTKPSEIMTALEQIIGRTDGIIVGQGFPLTPDEVNQSKRMFDSISKNKHHQVGGLIFPIQLSNFLNQRSKRTEEDRVTIVTCKSEYYGVTTTLVTKWFGLSCVLERIDVETKKPTKENGQVLLSSFETNELIKWFKKPSPNVQTYFSLTLGYTDPMDDQEGGDDEQNDDNLCKESHSQINFNLGDTTLKSLMKHNMFMKNNLYQTNNLAITTGDLHNSDDIEEHVTMVPDTPKRLMGPKMKARQLAAVAKQQGKKGRKQQQQLSVVPETDDDERERQTSSRKRKRPTATVVESDNDDDDDITYYGPSAKAQYTEDHEINE